MRVPRFPECAEPCGACFNADDALDLWVVELLAEPGQQVAADAVVAVVETNKTTIEVSAPRAGRVGRVMVRRGDRVAEDALLMTVDD